MVTILKQSLGILPRPKISLEAQVRSTKFHTAYPDKELEFNEWAEYIYAQLNGKLTRKRRKS